ncbi:hypothetical protein [Pseudomonas brassicacearum]|uniref:Uncharacterized protein n=1 Tax=Pseudomonas brassicacearum TaxID=930166 RepID=A0A423GIJ0_9PSED|nr:hypothetical protein [Pseudomonas brassicacearum]ROM89387.1 hypothetical protein BK658_28145 [Pseudomonas brassicacearum]
MNEIVDVEKGSVSFRLRKTVVAIVLARYKQSDKVLMSVPLIELESRRPEILSVLERYRNGPTKWQDFMSKKLPSALQKREFDRRLLGYVEMKKVLAEFVWSLQQHTRTDKKGARGGQGVGYRNMGCMARNSTDYQYCSRLGYL